MNDLWFGLWLLSLVGMAVGAVYMFLMACNRVKDIHEILQRWDAEAEEEDES